MPGASWKKRCMAGNFLQVGRSENISILLLHLLMVWLGLYSLGFFCLTLKTCFLCTLAPHNPIHGLFLPVPYLCFFFFFLKLLRCFLFFLSLSLFFFFFWCPKILLWGTLIWIYFLSVNAGHKVAVWKGNWVRKNSRQQDKWKDHGKISVWSWWWSYGLNKWKGADSRATTKSKWIAEEQAECFMGGHGFFKLELVFRPGDSSSTGPCFDHSTMMQRNILPGTGWLNGGAHWKMKTWTSCPKLIMNFKMATAEH